MSPVKYFLFVFCICSVVLGQTFQDFINRVNSSPQNQRESIVDSFYIANPRTPYFEQDTLCYFLYRGTASQAAMAGDANGWNPANGPMSKLSTTNLWYRGEVYPIDTRLDYKLVINGLTWIFDPLNPFRSPSGFGQNSELRMPAYIPPAEIEFYPEIAHGVIWDTTFYSLPLGNSRQIKVYLPPSYYAGNDSFAVVLFHDGLEFIDLAKANNVLDYIIWHSRIEPVIAVFVPPLSRTQEYAGSLQPQFTSFIVSEIMSAIDSLFRTRKNPAKRAVLGASYGGNISLWIGFNHPETFGNIAAYSSYIQPTLVEGFQTQPRKNLKLYLDIGTYDIALLIPMVHNFIPILQQKEYPYKFLEINDAHSWANWRGHIDDALEYFFPGEVLSVNEKNSSPSSNQLKQNFPNPFNPQTYIHVSLAKLSHIELEIYNIRGQKILTLGNTELPTGEHRFLWDGRNDRGKILPSGVYFYRLKIDGKVAASKRMVFLK